MSDKGKKIALDWIEKNKNKLIDVSDAIWGFAELGLIEYKSSKLLVDELEHHGFKVIRELMVPGTDFKNWSLLREK